MFFLCANGFSVVADNRGFVYAVYCDTWVAGHFREFASLANKGDIAVL